MNTDSQGFRLVDKIVFLFLVGAVVALVDHLLSPKQPPAAPPSSLPLPALTQPAVVASGANFPGVTPSRSACPPGEVGHYEQRVIGPPPGAAVGQTVQPHTVRVLVCDFPKSIESGAPKPAAPKGAMGD